MPKPKKTIADQLAELVASCELLGGKRVEL
jgi:hypothetical protein